MGVAGSGGAGELGCAVGFYIFSIKLNRPPAQVHVGEGSEAPDHAIDLIFHNMNSTVDWTTRRK